MANQTSPVIQVKDSNVGIGTTNPAVRLSGRVLSLNDTSVNLQSSIELLRNGNSSGEIFVNSDNMVVGSYETGIPLVFRTQNNEHLRITSGGNVGIGTTSPSYKLDVYGDIRSGGADPLMILQPDSGTYAFFQKLSSSNGNYLRLYDGTNYSTFWKDGNVGIGTASPAVKLEVSTLGYGFRHYGDASNYLRTYVGSGYQILDNGTNQFGYFNGKFYVQTGGADKLTIDTSGNVGIGTTAPTDKLHVVGSFRTTLDGTYNQGILNEYVSTYVTRTKFGRPDTSSNLELYYDIAGSEEARLTRNYTSAKLKFDRGATTDMIIDGSGNVGIGTTSPSFKLDVNGNTRIGGNSGSNTARLNVGGAANEWVADFQASTTTNQSYGLVVRAGTSSTDFPFYVLDSSNSTAFFAIKGNGNVGIGTTAPGARLHVNGGNVLIDNSSDVSLIFAKSGVSKYEWYLDNASNNFGLYDRGNLSWRFFVTNAGNVGIGTTSPNATLEVDGSFNVRNGNGDVTHFNYIDGSTNYVRGVTYFDTNSAYFTGGNVGIGTTAPIRKLSILDVGSSFQLRIGYSNDYYYDIGRDPNDGYFDFYGNQTGFIGYRFGGVDGTRLSITPAGNVGIGTTAPTSKLYIEGGSADWNETTPGLSVGTIHLDPGTGTNDYGNAITFGASDAGGGTNAQAGIYLRSDGNYGTKMYFATTDSYAAGSKTRMFIGHDGNVGIGTAGPNYKLEVSGTGFFGGVLRASVANTFPIRAIATSGGVSRISFEDNVNQANDAVWVGSEGYNLCFGSSFSEQARISSSGNLIIGSTTDAGYKLDVHGEILGRDDIRILNTYALILNGTDANWRIGRNTITDTGWLTGNTMQMVVFGGQTGQGFQVVNHNGTALFEIDGVAGASRFTNALGVGVNPSGTAGRIDASNDIVAYSTSDLRLKENIKPIENALDKVKALTGVEFDWKEDTKAVHGYEGHDVGVIAQEVQAVLPEAVRTNDSGYLSVRYEKMIALLVEANKELASRVEELEKKLK